MIGDKRGVTLMELLVVLGVFSTVVLITSAIFLQSNQAQRRVLALTAAQADIRFAFETVVREVRAGRIDYDSYAASGGISIPTSRLVLKNASGNRLEFYLDNAPSVCPTGSSGCLAVRIDGGTPQSVTSRGVSLERLNFFVSPQADPYAYDPATGLYLSNAQPLVTVALRAKTVSPKPEDVVTFKAQTSVAARTYAR